jgi:hypothetical protein
VDDILVRRAAHRQTGTGTEASDTERGGRAIESEHTSRANIVTVGSTGNYRTMDRYWDGEQEVDEGGGGQAMKSEVMPTLLLLSCRGDRERLRTKHHTRTSTLLLVVAAGVRNKDFVTVTVV